MTEAISKYNDKTETLFNMHWLFAPSAFTKDGEWWTIISVEKTSQGEILSWRYQGQISGNILTVINQ